MEQYVVVRFFTFKGLSHKDIYIEFESMYMDETLCLHTVYKWHERFMQERTELFNDSRSRRPLQNDLVDALRVMIQELSFTSCKRLRTNFILANSICMCILHDVLHLKKFNLRWVLHFLDDAQKAERVSFSMDILMVLKENQKNGSAQVITDDESRFISIIFINRSESRPEMRFQKKSNKELTRKNA
jgi:hypothetical protein